MNTTNNDTVFICSGSCRGAFIRPGHCKDPKCSQLEEKLHPAEAVYVCSGRCGMQSAAPGRCSTNGCYRAGDLLECKAKVPRSLQLALLDPPEEKRSYSSIWEEDAIGTGSRMDSAQGWSAGSNDNEQWMIIDAGEVVDSISGILVANRADGGFTQLVTELSIEVKEKESNKWTEIVANKSTNISMTDNVVLVYFPQPVRARYVKILPQKWEKHISMRCALLLHGAAADSFRQKGDSLGYRSVWDLNQMPAKIPHYFVAGGLPPPLGLPRSGSLGVTFAPEELCEWEGRRSNWIVLEFNGKPNEDRGTRVFAALPSQRYSIRVDYTAGWGRNQNDYGPGCIVQLYYGMAKTFCTGVVEYGIDDHQGQSRTEFIAPEEPGLYYITSSISLQYRYVDNLSEHGNTPKNAFAAVRVLPTRFSPEIFPVLPQAEQRQIIVTLAWSNHTGTAFGALGGHRHVLYHIFSFLLGQNVQPQ